MTSLIKTIQLVVCLAALLVPLTGCRSRGHHVQQADHDAYCLIKQKTGSLPWAVPDRFSIQPSAASRLYDSGCQVCPQLPMATTTLYNYQLPYLNSRNRAKADELDQQSAVPDNLLNPIGSPIPIHAWTAIPDICLERMLDFESLREEAKSTLEKYGEAPSAEGVDDSNQLTLTDVVDIALLNSREFQSQKETLYQVSLQLSLERFDYQTKFGRNGNGVAGNFTTDRNGGTTVNRFSIPSGISIERMLVTGGDLMARFANNVLLTFDGPAGFTADVSSNILIEFAQPLLQVDVQFESLTQAERNLVYAARDFARFRKQFFVDFASQYYSLIRTFRQVEIDSQNYFLLVRAFSQAEAEFQAGFLSRVEVDQIEQSLLSGRGRLIGTCNGLEQSLDRLKILLGIPTETPINVDLTELNELTRLDQLSVSADSTNRVLTRLKTALTNPDRSELVSTASVLLDRIIETEQLIGQVDPSSKKNIPELKRKRARFQIEYSRLTSQQIASDFEREISSDSPSVPVVFQRSIAHSESLLKLVQQQLGLSRLADNVDDWAATEIERLHRSRLELLESTQSLKGELQTLIEEERLDGLPGLVESSKLLSKMLIVLVADADKLNAYTVEADPEADLVRIIQEVEELMAVTSATLESSEFGLKSIEIDVDDAMITALVLRLDVMNQRGGLADDWRQVKLAADELKSVIDLNATHRVNTNPGVNKPFDFTFDESTTSLRLTVDAPLNRRAQRNSYRGSLINYQRAIRNLTALEDNIKFSVRNDLRSLALNREQYLIAVASAALAFERVVSTSLEFRLGTRGVVARDFLDAQTAYTDSLNAVADQHIAYIVNRAQLFLDLELLIVDEEGFWQEIRSEQIQPLAYLEIPYWAQPVYGELPAVRYSDEIQQMNCLSPADRPRRAATWFKNSELYR